MPAQEQLKLFSACQADLGESPVWDEAHQCLLFVDISGGDQCPGPTWPPDAAV